MTWTLSIEIAWYALFALMFMWRGEAAEAIIIKILPVLFIVAALVSLIIAHRIPLARPGLVYAALIGCRTYRYFQGKITAKELYTEIAIFLAVSASCNLVSFGYFKHPAISGYQAVIPWLIAPAIFFAAILVPRLRNSGILNNPKTAFLGAISYSIYMLHPFALIFAHTYFEGALTLIIGLAATLALSVLGYKFIELPGQQLGRRVVKLLEARTAPVSV